MTTTKLSRAHTALLRSLDLAIEQASDPAVSEASAPTVSRWSVREHLEHLSIADGGIVTWIEKASDADPELEARGSPNLLGRIILVFGTFPRGRGKAPEWTLPTGVGAEELAARFSRIRERVEGLGGSLERLQACRSTRNHYVFGDLNATQWLCFAVIHDNHHQKIIRDVLKASGSRQ